MATDTYESYESEASDKTSGGGELYSKMDAVRDIYRGEAAKCVLMVVAFAFGLAHLYAYHDVVGTEISPAESIPPDELRYFHLGWTAMLVIFLVEFCSVSLKIWCTWHSPVLAEAVARKLEGNIGVLFGEYIVVAATYVIMGYNLMPVFLEARTGRRVYGVRYMEWTVDACGLVYLDCHILFNQPVRKFYMAFVWSVAYMLFGMWSAIAPSWVLYWVFLAASWLTFFFVCIMLIRFLQKDPKPLEPFSAGVKPCILAFIILWWVCYGVLFMVAFAELVPQWLEQFLWTGMDVIMKLSHTVVLMAWRSAQWDIDAVVKRTKAEAQRFLAQLDKDRAVIDRDRARLLATLKSKDLAEDQNSPVPYEREALDEKLYLPPEAEDPVPRKLPADGMVAHEATATSGDLAHLGGCRTADDVTACFIEVATIYKGEAVKCAVMCVLFVASVLHLYIYPELNVISVPPEDVPFDELYLFSHGWNSMLVVFLIETFTVILKISCTWHQPVVALAQAQKLSGNIGALFGEYLVVGATYVIMAYNFMPVFMEPRTGRRVYGVRYMEWLVDACGLISLDCHCLFNRSFKESRMLYLWTVAYVMFGLWSALASTWLWYWIFLLCSWLTFALVCGGLVRFLWLDPYPLEPFNRRSVKPSILAFIIIWWVLYGVVFMVSFQAPELLPQWVEQLLWTGMDVIMKLSHTIILIAWRETQWDVDTLVSRRKIERDRRAALQEIQQIRTAESQLQDGMSRASNNNWTLTPGLNVGVPDIVRLEVEVGQGALNEGQLRSMMSRSEFSEWQRLERLGVSQAQLQAKWQGQIREQTFLKHGIHNIAYDPMRWSETLIGIRGRAAISYPCWIIIAVAVVVAVLKESLPQVIEPLEMDDTIHSLVGGAVMFLVVFRTQYAFRKWWDGRKAFGRVVLYSRTLAQQVCAYISDDFHCQRVVNYTIAAVVGARCNLRNEHADSRMLLGVLGEKEIQTLNKQAHMPSYATWIIRSTIGKAMTAGKCLPFHMAMDNSLKAMEESIADAERMLTPMPFIYVAHLRFFLFLYLLFLPMVLISELGRLMVLAVALSSYLLVGLEYTAVTLENPFGYDLNDLPLDLYCIEVSRNLLGLLELRALEAETASSEKKRKGGDDEADDDE